MRRHISPGEKGKADVKVGPSVEMNSDTQMRACSLTCGLAVTCVRYSKLFCRGDRRGYVTVSRTGGDARSADFST